MIVQRYVYILFFSIFQFFKSEIRYLSVMYNRLVVHGYTMAVSENI